MAWQHAIGRRTEYRSRGLRCNPEKTIGQPIAETQTVREFKQGPVDASRKLNEATNYLTGARLPQLIRAL